MEIKTTDWQTLSAVCRCCRSKGCHKEISTAYFWMGKREVYKEMLAETFNLTISVFKSEDANSGISNICDTCILKLRDATEFKRQVLECEQTFNKYLELATSADDPLDSTEDTLITFDKIEVKLENVTDNESNENIFVYEYNNDDEGDTVGSDSVARDETLMKKPTIVKKLKLSEIKRKRQHVSHNTKVGRKKHNEEQNIFQNKKEKTFKSFICDICDKIFKSKHNLRLHLLSNKCSRGLDQTSKLQRRRLHHTGEKRYKCDVCEKSYSQSSHLREHKNIHTGLKPYKCDVCDKSYSRSSHLSEHRFSHTGLKPFKCDLCEKSYSRSSHLRQHRFIHTGQKPFKCDVCDKSFSLSSSLRQHRVIHTGEKPFKCDVCEKCFSQASSLLQHKLIHTGEKPFKCDVCEKDFSRSAHLREHRIIHTGDKPYKCDVCEKSFIWSCSLRQHKFIHTGEKPFKCDICVKSFNSSSNLHKHRLIHTGDKPFK